MIASAAIAARLDNLIDRAPILSPLGEPPHPEAFA